MEKNLERPGVSHLSRRNENFVLVLRCLSSRGTKLVPWPLRLERTNPRHEEALPWLSPPAYGRDSDFDLPVGGIRSLEGTHMTNWITLPITLTLTFGAFSSSARAQAAAQYGVLAGHSGVVTTKIASGLGSKARQLDERQGARLKSVESTMEENRRQLEAKGQKEGGAVHIDSVPPKATILVDGAPIAYTPAELKIPEGKHVIELKRPASLPWRKEISISRGEKLSLNGELQDKYKSVLTFSIQK